MKHLVDTDTNQNLEEKQPDKKAVALQYDKDKDNAPKVVEKGSRYLADEIINIATKHDIPIKQDKDMVMLLDQIEVNREIPPNMYKAVAEIFSFIYGITNEVRNKNN
jgi:flagellar biosynthesis protein